MSVRIPAPSPHPCLRRPPLLRISVICSFFRSVPPPLRSFAPLLALTLYLLRPLFPSFALSVRSSLHSSLTPLPSSFDVPHPRLLFLSRFDPFCCLHPLSLHNTPSPHYSL